MSMRQRWFFFLFTVCFFLPSFSADIGNCLLCHKYPGLSRVDEEGKLRLFYVNEEIFKNSVHARTKCEGCHTDVKKIPHDPVKKVNCLIECHLEEPTLTKKFSHENPDKSLSLSVHGKTKSDGSPKPYQEDFPSCKDCHDNSLYRPIAFFRRVQPGFSEAALNRCRACHEKEEFVFRFYNHITSRLHRSRSPQNTAEICERCHDDPKLVARHQLSTRAVISYEESFHGKASSFLDERIPDCLNCHVTMGESAHLILSHENPRSSTHPVNKAQSCLVADCHPNASPKLADYQLHAEFSLESPGRFYFTVFFIFLTGCTLLPLMLIIFLDLLRRLFPHLILVRRR